MLDQAAARTGWSGAGGSTPSWRTVVSTNPALQGLTAARRVLLLQGPVGPFFDRLTRWLVGRGTEVRRVVFQGGDEHDCRLVEPFRFQLPPSEWPAAFGKLLDSWRPDCVALFGQSRYYHKVALERARALDVPAVVMEEGYFRPGFVTMELGGVNGYSTTVDRYEWVPCQGDSEPRPDACDGHFQRMAWHAARHYVALHAARAAYPGYLHHRSTDLRGYAAYWLRSWIRKYRHLRADLRFQQALLQSGRPYFFVPLQLEGDSQIRLHSPFRDVAEFALQVLESFAAHAPPDAWLVFRQHPHSRGGPGHGRLIHEVARALGIAGRVHHVVEGDTPELAQHSAGTVVINSTVGLQALERGAPLAVLGDSFYRRPGLAAAGDLDTFWTRRAPAHPEVAAAFLRQLKALTQAPASIYAPAEAPIAWAT